MTRDEKINKLMNERLNALTELKKVRKTLTTKLAKKRIDNDIEEICRELHNLHMALCHW